MTSIDVHRPFDNQEHQTESVELGMWIFLLTEAMLFGALILCYSIMRILHPSAFSSASQLLNMKAGALNTSVLLTSSLTMALAVRASELGRRRTLALFLAVTALLGMVFLGIKGYEYHTEWLDHLVPNSSFSVNLPEAPFVRLFFNIYFILTGLHALHLFIGSVWLTVLSAISVFSERYTGSRSITIHSAGLYWHFVDCVWVFLFPLLYLIGGSA